MKLPDAKPAIVDRDKIVLYLLNPIHPDNGGKARFFMSFGFTSEDWNLLADAFRQLAGNAPVLHRIDSAHGQKYILDGPIPTPSGKMAYVRTIWIVDRGAQAARLVTAYPSEPSEEL